jgi:hypothetical protein
VNLFPKGAVGGGVDTLLKLRHINKRVSSRAFLSQSTVVNINIIIISNIMAIDTPSLKKRRVSVSDTAGYDIPAPAPVSQLLVKKHSDKAKIPTRGSSLAAGYDLYR